MAETIRGINVVIGADTTGLSKALSDVNKRSKDIQSELKQVEKLLKLDPSNTELLAQKQKLLGDAIANTREKLDRLRAVQEQVNEQFARGEISEGQYRAFQREVVKTEQELASLEKRLESVHPDVQQLGDELEDAGQQAKTAGDRFKEAGDKLKSAGEAMTNAGKKLSVGVTAPIVGLGTVATKAAVDFESAFAGVRKTVDATEEQFAQLEQGIRDMSKRMPAAATDIAAVAEAAGQLGIETDNILKFTETMIGLGEATNLTAEEGATQFARFANIVGMSQSDFDRLGSAVVALGNNFATTEAEIVEMGLRLAGQGAQIGMTEAQVMALAAAMSSVGIEAEAGGTAMSTVLKRMQNAVSLAGEDLDKFAAVARMSAEEFARAFQADPATALQGFIDGLAESSRAGENLTLILDDLGITGIRESDTLLRLAGANDTLRDALSTATGAWEENIALQKEVEQRYSTTESQMGMFRNQLEDAAITLGQALIPALMDMLDALRPVIDMLADGARWFANLDEGTQKVIVGIAAFVAAVGPLLMVLGPIVSGIGSLVSGIGALIPVVTGATAAGGGFAAVMTAITGPVGIAIAAIAGLAAAAYLIIKNWEPIKGFFTKLWDDISSYLSQVWRNISDAMTKAWNALMDKIRPILEGYKTFFSGVWDAIKNIFAGALLLIIDLVTGDFKNLSKDAQAIWNNLKDAFRRIWDGIKQIFSGALDLLKSSWSAAWNTIKSTADSIWQAIKDGIQRAINWIKGLPSQLTQLGKDMIQGLVNGIKNMIGSVGDAVKNIADRITGGLRNLLDIRSPSRVLMQLGEYTGEGFVRGLEKTVDAVRREAAEMAATVTGGLSGLSMPGVAVAGGAGAARVTNVSMEGMFAGANFYVRSDADIQAIARELYRLQQNAARGAGL